MGEQLLGFPPSLELNLGKELTRCSETCDTTEYEYLVKIILFLPYVDFLLHLALTRCLKIKGPHKDVMNMKDKMVGC